MLEKQGKIEVIVIGLVLCFGGLEIFSFLVKVAFDGWDGLWKIFCE